MNMFHKIIFARRLAFRGVPVFRAPGYKRDVQAQDWSSQERQNNGVPCQNQAAQKRVKKCCNSVELELAFFGRQKSIAHEKPRSVRCIINKKPVKCLPSLEVQTTKIKSTKHPPRPIVRSPASIKTNSRWFSSPTALVNQRQ